MSARSVRRLTPQHLAAAGIAVLAVLGTACGADQASEEDGASAPTAADGSPTAGSDPTASVTASPNEEAIEDVSLASNTGGTTAIVIGYIEEQDLAAKHGLNLDYELFDSLQTSFSEFTAGRFDFVVSGPDALASMAGQGVPVSIPATIEQGATSIIAGPDVQSVEDLRGKRVTGVGASGAFNFTLAVLEEWYGVDLEEEAEIASTRSPMEAVAQVLAGSADAVIGWEPPGTSALQQDSDLHVVSMIREEFKERTGHTFWQVAFGEYIDREVSDSAREKLIALWQEATTALMESDPAEVDELAQRTIGAPEGLYGEAIGSGRLYMDVQPLTDEIAEDIRAALSFQQEAGDIPTDLPDTFLRVGK